MSTDPFNLLLSLVAFLMAFLLVIGLASRYVQRRMRRQRLAKETAPASVPGWPRRRHLAYAAVAFTLVAVYGSLVPLNFHPVPVHDALQQFARLPMLELGIESRADWVANILLFVPIGLFCMGALNVDRPPGRHWPWSSGLVGFGCLGLSVALEFAQIWFPPRTVSQNDIMAETIGAVGGCALWMTIGPTVVQWLRGYSREALAQGQLEWLLSVYVIGLLIYSVLPLDLTISPAELYRGYREGKVAVIPLSDIEFDARGLYVMVRDFAIFVPVGIFAVTWRRRAKRRFRPLSEGMVLVFGVAGLTEMAQFFVHSRYASSTDVIIGVLGGLAGAWGARRWGRGRRMAGEVQEEKEGMGRAWLWASAATVYALFLFALFCWPGTLIEDSTLIRERYASFWRVPFAAMYWGSEFNAVSQLLKRILLFGVLGGLLFLTIESITPRGRIRLVLLLFALLAVATFGLAIEMAQVLIPPHVPDITDVALYVLGGLIGMTVTVRIRRSRGPTDQ